MRKIILILIFCLAFLLRFWNLGKYPSSLDWDEASLGYNAYSIIKTARDEYGSFLPLQFRSFGDFKPPFYVYSLVPVVYLLNLTELAVRLPSALFGFGTVVLVYFLVKKLFPQLNNSYHLLITFLLAISPWHIQFSRIAFEANVGLFWYILGTLLFINIPKNKNFIFFSALAYIAGIYTYHSLRLVAPIFVLGLVLILREILLKNKKTVFLALVFSFILVFPLLLLLKGGLQARFSSVSNINSEVLVNSIQQMEYDIERGDSLGKLLHNRRITYFLGILKGYFDHWNLSFLFIKGDGPDRHHAPDMGMLYLIELPFLLIGIYQLLLDKNNIFGKKVIFWWFLVAPLASSLTTGTPHAVRALLYLPTFQVFVAFGIKQFLESYSNMNKPAIIFLKRSFLVLIYFGNMFYYLDMYYLHGPLEQAESWQYGYKQVVDEVKKIKSNYTNVVITYKYDQPYIYFLFYEKTDPSWYQQYWLGKNLEIERFERTFGNYIFRDIEWEQDKNLKNTLLVGTPREIPQDSLGVIKEINYPNGEVAFRLVSLK